MIRQDYIMRMIEQLVKVLSKIFFNKKEENYEEAVKNIDSAFNSILGLDYNLLNTLSENDIISLLSISKNDPSVNIKYIIIAKLLKERKEMENLINDGNHVSVSDYQKILSLYLEGILNNKNEEIDLHEYYNDVKEIVKKIDDNKLPRDTKLKLLEFYDLMRDSK